MLIAALVAVVLVGFLGALAFRSQRRSATDGQSAPTTVLPTEPPENRSEQGALLVPLPNARDEALVLGSDQELAALERAGLIQETSGPSKGPLPQVVRTVIAAGGTEANRRAAAGVESGRIVALSKDTMKHLENYAEVRVMPRSAGFGALRREVVAGSSA